MFDKLRQSKLMFWSIWLLVIATLIFVSSKIDFLFAPIGTFFSTLFAPILVAGFLYYILNPLVNLFERLKIKRIFAILLVFLLLVGAIAIMIGSIIPHLSTQIASLASNMPKIIDNIEAWFNELIKLPYLQELDIDKYLNQLNLSYGDILQNVANSFTNSIGSVFSTVASTAMVIFTAPFILFYMLKDGDRLIPFLEKLLPEKQRDKVVDLLGQMNETIATYISGQAIECLFVVTFTFIGYWLVGVDYAFLFGMIAGITNLIPYLGPYLGLAPAVLVTVFQSPFKALLCCVVVIIVQQLDGNIIYPNVIGKTLKIHPLTIILILLVAGNLSGLLGIFLGVPVYAVSRTVVVYLYGIYKASKAVSEPEAEPASQSDE